jgi:hypothetical protein
MRQVRVSVEIERPAEEVFAFLSRWKQPSVVARPAVVRLDVAAADPRGLDLRAGGALPR